MGALDNFRAIHPSPAGRLTEGFGRRRATAAAFLAQHAAEFTAAFPGRIRTASFGQAA
jgi:hypothetical protein